MARRQRLAAEREPEMSSNSTGRFAARWRAPHQSDTDRTMRAAVAPAWSRAALRPAALPLALIALAAQILIATPHQTVHLLQTVLASGHHERASFERSESNPVRSAHLAAGCAVCQAAALARTAIGAALRDAVPMPALRYGDTRPDPGLVRDLRTPGAIAARAPPEPIGL